MNRLCRHVSNSYCKNVISFCNGNFSNKLLPHKLNKDFESLISKAIACRTYSTIQLRLKKGKSCTSYENINGLGSYKLHIRWKGWGYNNFGHRDDEKTPLITKVFYLVPTIGMLSLFVDWPLVLEYAINRARNSGFNVPQSIADVVECKDEESANSKLKRSVSTITFGSGTEPTPPKV